MNDYVKLERLQLTNFKSIKKLDIKLENLNILLGQNGAGKSNFISFFKLMNKILNQDLQFYIAEQGGVDRFLYFGRKESQEIKIDLYFSKLAGGYGALLVPTLDGKLIFKDEHEKFSYEISVHSVASHAIDSVGRHAIPSPSLVTKDSPESGLQKLSLATKGETESLLRESQHLDSFERMNDWKTYHFHDTSEKATVKYAGNINDTQRLHADASNLAAFLYLIKKTAPECYKKIVGTVNRVAPFFQDFILEPDPLSPELIRLRWKHKGSDDYFDAHSFSDGTLRFICLATLLLQPKLPSMILLDEPELGLHPFAIQLLAGLMRSAATQTQVIASTQSVTLANEFHWQDIIVVKQNGYASEFERLTETALKPWLEEYEIGDIWQKNLIGGTPSC